MTAVGRIQSEQGRIVLVVAICLMIGWALALVNQAQQYLPADLPKPDVSDLKYQRERLIALRPKSLLEQFYQELGTHILRLDPTGGNILSPDQVVVLLYPEAQVPKALATELMQHVESGGRLVVFLKHDLDFLSELGVVARAETSSDAVSAGAAVDLAHVAATRGWARLVLSSGKRNVVPLLTSNTQGIVAGLVGVGKGTVTIVTTDFTHYEDIEDRDNPIFLANLILGETRGAKQFGPSKRKSYQSSVPTVRVIDYDPEVLQALYRLDAQAVQRAQQAIASWRYDSFWALVRVNPAAAAALQLALGLLIFMIARGRRLGAPLPDGMGESTLPGLLAGRAALMERHNAVQLAIAQAVHYHHRWLVHRLGIGSDATAASIAESLRQIAPRAATLFSDYSSTLVGLSSRDKSTDESLLVRIWSMIDAMQKELKTS